MKKRLLGPLVFVFYVQTAFAQVDSVSVDDISLEDLLNMKVTVASQKGSTLRETPGIVTVITEEEIKSSGARDFVDLMRLVPGIDFGSDVGDQVGFFVRGNWGNEGKVLIMQDGIQLNENSYGTVFLTDYVLVSNIKKIEVIRGPGSAMYGGMAGLAVINIITKSGEELKGGNVTATYGNSNGKTLRNNVQVALGTKTKSGFEIDGSAFINKSKFSNQTMDDRITGPINYADSSKISNYSVALHAGFKGLHFRAFNSQYYNRRVDYTVQSIYNSRTNLQLEYEWKIGSKFTIKPKVLWQNQAPWNYNGPEYADEVYNAINNRYLANVTASYELNEHLHFMGGVEYFDDNSNVKYPSDTNAIFVNGSKKLHYTNLAAFAQGTLTTKILNLTVGARYNKHSAFNDAFVPRIALTKSIKDFHFKLLYSTAFKAPLLENIDYNASIKPENISTAELEIGYKFTPTMWVTANIFDQTVRQPIVYYDNGSGSNSTSSYQNFNRAATQGFEVEYRMKMKRISATATYSFYHNKNTDVPYFVVPGNTAILRGVPTSKVTLNGGVSITKSFSINPTFVFYSPKSNYTIDTLGIVSKYNYGPNVLMHMFFQYKDLLLKGLEVGAGVYNILDQNLFYINAYSSDVRSLPYSGREYLIRGSFTF